MWFRPKKCLKIKTFAPQGLKVIRVYGPCRFLALGEGLLQDLVLRVTRAKVRSVGL